MGVSGRKAVSSQHGQVAQVVERSPEKAGVGGSTPSLATTFRSSGNLATRNPQSHPEVWVLLFNLHHYVVNDFADLRQSP